jgi:hypothetical protein
MILALICLHNNWEESNGPNEQHLVFFRVSTTVFFDGFAGRPVR